MVKAGYVQSRRAQIDQVIMIDINHFVHLQIMLTLDLRTAQPFSPMLLMIEGLIAVRKKFVSSRGQKLKLEK